MLVDANMLALQVEVESRDAKLKYVIRVTMLQRLAPSMLSASFALFSFDCMISDFMLRADHADNSTRLLTITRPNIATLTADESLADDCSLVGATV